MTNKTGDARIGHCRICNAQIAPFMSFGRMPIANGFLKPDEIEREYFFELGANLSYNSLDDMMAE